MYYTIYETINLINQKKYLGMHITNLLADGYLGSGTYLKRAIKKHGKENFIKTYLWIFDNKKEMKDKEIELITKTIIDNKNYYNIKLGGEGGTLPNSLSKKSKLKMSLAKKGIPLTEKHKKNISKVLSGENNPRFGKKLTVKERENISLSMKGRFKGEKHHYFGKQRTNEVKNKIRNKLLGHKQSLKTCFKKSISGLKRKRTKCNFCERNITFQNIERHIRFNHVQ